jgi:clathrin heavy chain
LNELETIELTRPVLAQGRKDLIEKWLNADQLFCNEMLGDMVRSLDRALAVRIYEKAGCKSKVVQCFAESGQYDLLVGYCKKEGFQPNWMQLLQAVIATNPPAAANFAKMLLTAEGGPLLDANAVIDAFMARQLVKETTSVMLDILAANRPEDGVLQTRLLEINLKFAPVVAEAIFENNMFSHYDYNVICQAAHAVGLTHRALQHTTDINEAKRLLVTARNLNPQILIGFFSKRTASQTIECLRELLRNNLQQNLEMVIAVGVKFTPLPTAEQDPEILSPEKMISLFEEFHCFPGTYHYLKQIIALHKTNKFVVFKFIEAAASLQPPEMQAIEMAVREYEYEPERVRDFLKEKRLPDQLPLVLVCDKFHFIPELTTYLYKNNMMSFIEAYVQNMNPLNTPAVVGALIDLACDDDKIQHILNTVGHLCPVDTLVEEVEKRSKLKMLRGWLDARISEGNKESATHDARAKIFILMNDERKEQFLVQNECYNSLTVGKFCESHDAYLAYVAYKRGKCHDQLIDVTNRHGLFKYQARYLVEEQDTNLWAKVLSPSNEYRRQVIDEVVQVALPETKRADMVSSTVKAFMEADLPNELIVLLEKIVLQGTEEEFRTNRNLQNLLLLTAIKADKGRVMEYIEQLDAFDAREIAEIAIDAYLFEEAFVIYKKFRLNVKAIQVLVKNIKNLDRAVDFADSCSSSPDAKEVYFSLGEAQLNEGFVVEAIESFMKAEDHSLFERVVESAKKVNALEPLSKYLKMCRKKSKK